MAGLIQQNTSQPAKGSMDPLLSAIKDGIESKLDPNTKDDMDRIVVSGMKILYSPQTHQTVSKIYDHLAQSQFQPNEIANGMVSLMLLIMQGSKGNASLVALYPAGIVLLTYVLDDLEKTHGLRVTSQLVQQVEPLMRQKFMKLRVQQEGAPPAPGSPATAPPPGNVPIPASVTPGGA